MRIALDLTPLQPPLTGVGQYTHGLLRGLLAANSGYDFRAWSTGLRPLRLDAGFAELPHKHFGLPTRFMYKSWELLHAPNVDVLLGGVDVVHATNFFLPPVKRAKRVATVYDLAFIKNPEWASPKIVGPFSRGIRRFVRDADAVITISEASKQDLVEILGVDTEKIHIAYPAVEDEFTAVPQGEAQRLVASRHGLTTPYILFVGTLEPRKNITGLLEAYAAIKESIPHALVLAGGEGWNKIPTAELVEKLGLNGRVVRLGYLQSRAELPALYSAADMFVLPSHYEGFGMPVLEAMRCGCPVITANNSALPEVGGGAVQYVDSKNAQEIAAAMKTLALDKYKQGELREKGPKQAANFSWARCAADTLAVYRGLA